MLAFREFGRGYSGLCYFAMNMNMTQRVTKKNYTATNEKLLLAFVDAAKASMKIAAEEIIESTPRDEMDVANCDVSIDGTWQKRGFSSRNGVVTIIGKYNGKCIDCQVLCKHKSCQIWERKNLDPKLSFMERKASGEM